MRAVIELPATPRGHEPFHIRRTDADGPGGWRGRLFDFAHRSLVDRFAPPIESMFGLEELNRVYERIGQLPPAIGFAERALATLDVTADVPEADLKRVPAAGPLIVVANHPFGGVDGLALLSLLKRVRPDVKLLANHMLSKIPELGESCIFVDPFGGNGATTRNLSPLRDAVRWVRQGGTLAVFPAGEVSHLNLRQRAVTDGPWQQTVAWIARQSVALVLPVFFAGRNRPLFHALGLIHPRLRTAMLPRELLASQHSRLDIRVGNVIAPERLADFEADPELISYLRIRTYILQGRSSSEPRMAGSKNTRPELVATPAAPIAAAEPAGLLADEIHRLPEDRLLAAGGPLVVYHAKAVEIPFILREIGRLRELAFRGAGEGTGRERDLDRFDPHYRHLFVWDTDRREIVGGYRLGATDEIVPRFGPAGLYTHTLFKYGDRLLSQINPALELGRSFVRPERQKEYAPLMLLWKGIARFVVQRPRYKMLIGPVSISNDYQSLTRQLLACFLRLNRYLPSLGQFVQPRNAPRRGASRELEYDLAATSVKDLGAVEELVAEIEQDRRSVPVLLRQYLKLNAKLLGFNVDSNFGDVLDALMLVDLTQVPRAVLARYMGSDGAAGFLAHHAALVKG
jgi:putative hemolysin